MDYSNEYVTLVQDFRLYIEQNYSIVEAVAPPKPKAAPPPAPKPVTAPPIIAKKAPPPQPATPVKLPELPKTPIEPILKTAARDALAAQDFDSESLAKHAPVGGHSQVGKAPAGASDSGSKDCADRASPAAVFRIMQAMPRPFIPPAAVSLGDCLAKLQNLGIPTIDAPIDAPNAKLAECVVVSFYAPGSQHEAFIQKVASSITARLLPCSLYLQPGLQAAAECFTLAASARAKACILAYDQEDAPKVSQWLSYFGDDLKEDMQEKLKLTAKKSLFGVRLYELVALKSDDPEFKRALWNDLQSI